MVGSIRFFHRIKNLTQRHDTPRHDTYPLKKWKREVGMFEIHRKGSSGLQYLSCDHITENLRRVHAIRIGQCGKVHAKSLSTPFRKDVFLLQT